ncbi:hypothetical protein BS47DRAFT_1346698 [Hydnum rufescens UP504]|uniref:Actin-like ATPase domain-containing protein n=1 Tax=Hydnum rufescens UP504 TaxID=1448309 RepID=A0A9P6ATP7_9AGAM|nr:hypothetical protein BS47DRAFT_1346698 [Hydnum rufescens UP504]
MGKGVNVAGAPSTLSLSLALEAKAKIKRHMDMWPSPESPSIRSPEPQNPILTEGIFSTPLSLEPPLNGALVAQQPEEMTPKDPFIYSDDDSFATYVQPSLQSPLQPQRYPSTRLQLSHSIQIPSPSSSDEAQSPYGPWFPSTNSDSNGLNATHSTFTEHINPGAHTPLLDPNVVRPSPVHPNNHPSPIRSVSMPPPASLAHNPGFQNPGMGIEHVSNSLESSHAPSDEGKMSISIDFGTTFSGVAYGSARIASGKVQQILSWPGTSGSFRKIPTCLVYDDTGRVLAWGLKAKNMSPIPGTTRCEWFKLFLDPTALRDGGAVDLPLPKLPPGKQAIDLITDFLGCLWDYAKGQITREIGAVADLNVADVWLTVPAAWNSRGCQIMRDAALSAGLAGSAYANGHDWRDRLHIITEPEAAAVHCAHLTNLHQLRPTQNFMICDAGGGTVDLAVYKIIGSLTSLEIAEVCARSGSNCGSLFLDLRFRELVRTLVADHPAHLKANSLAYFMHSFSETDKLAYMGESDDSNMFHFTCFNFEHDDPSAGLINGELEIPGSLLRREVFDPVVEQVLKLIEEQIRRAEQCIDALLLVGGFSGSEYLFQRVNETFGSRIKVIARPPDADTATCRGAAQYGLARHPLVSSIIAPKSYIMRVKLPVELEDRQRRPAYIKKNDAGHDICENRLQYLVSKGAILRKGQRIKTKFCKFSATPQDRNFVAVIYASASDKMMRYTDEGEIFELCLWTVDVGLLPSFQSRANDAPGGFYIGISILDSTEVRGVLLCDGHECGRVTFDSLI